ncbi:MAG: thioredoxin family protein [Nannocystaceae bacterium]|nr:thioredoxin family protein [Myxococcales bacterium]
MALTPSQMLPLGTVAPDFSLPDTAGRIVTLSELDARGYLVAFLCNHCPYVKHLNAALAAFGRECADKGVAMIAISSNDVDRYPQDSPARMAEEAARHGYPFPYLYDESQAVARAYHAACTPDFFLFDGARRLVYRGCFDDSSPGNGRPITGAPLRAAVDAVVAGAPVSADQTPAMGCNIKWKPGNEPPYFG